MSRRALPMNASDFRLLMGLGQKREDTFAKLQRNNANPGWSRFGPAYPSGPFDLAREMKSLRIDGNDGKFT